MKKLFYIFLTLVCLFTFTKVQNVKADSALSVELANGASIRLQEPAGLRFSGKVDGTSQVSNVKYGIVFVIGEVEADALTKDTASMFYGECDELDENNEYHVSIVNIPETSYKTKVTARAYVDEDGTITYSSNAVVRCIYDVAKAYKESDAYVENEFVESVVSAIVKTKLSTPFGITLKYLGNNQLNVVMGASGASKYHIAAYTKGTNDIVWESDFDSLNYTFSNFNMQGEFDIRIKGVATKDTEEDSDYCDAIALTVDNAQKVKLSTPVGIVVTTYQDNTNFNVVLGYNTASNYHIIVYQKGTDTIVYESDFEGLNYTFTNFEFTGDFELIIKAVTSKDSTTYEDSDYSDKVSFTIKGQSSEGSGSETTPTDPSNPDSGSETNPTDPEPTEAAELKFYYDGKGNNRNHIDGAGVWVWIDTSSCGLDGSNFSQYTVEATCEKEGITITSYTISDLNIASHYARVYLVMNMGVAGNSTDEFVFHITLTLNDNSYNGTITFKGIELKDNANGGSETEPTEPTETKELKFYYDGEGNNRNHIDGAGVWVWIDTSSCGVDGSNFSNYTVEATCDKEGYAINDAFISDLNDASHYARVYLVMNMGVAGNSTDEFVFHITLTLNGVAYKGTITFKGIELKN